MRTPSGWIMAVVVAVLYAGCAAPVHGARRARYEAVDPKGGGTIVGIVRFDGKVPKPKQLKVTVEDKACHTGPIFSEELVVSAKKGVKWAVARIKKIARGKPFKKGEVAAQMDQKGCRFIPHVVVVPERRPLRIINSDGILHNVHTYAKFNRSLNKAMKGTVKKMDVSFKRRERVQLRCDVHKWMHAWIIVAEHPYYAVTGDDGTFRLEGVPAGTHTIEVWHETLGKQEKEVTVEAGKEARVDFVTKKK